MQKFLRKEKMKKVLKGALASAMALSLLAGCGGSKTNDEEVAGPIPVEMHAIVTDAGQYIDKMVIDYGDKNITGVDNETFEVKMTSTVTYGEAKDQPYAYYNAEAPIEVVKTEVDGSKVTVYFNQAQAGTLTWLAEGRNNPAALSFTVVQTKDLTEVTTDKRELPFTTEYTCTATSYKDLVDEEVAKFEDVQVADGINYQLHKGTNDKLIVWFHGNGEGDFPTKDTNNNIAQVLANRGTVAWVTPEAQEVFGDATVMAFQAPSVWYLAKPSNLLEQAYNEIQQVITDNNINVEEVYVSGCSAGGFMTTRMIIAYPDLFKAAMINCPALDIANLRSETEDATPSDEELAVLTTAKTKIWLVQGETDSSVNPADCSLRIWNVLTNGVETTEQEFAGTADIASGFKTVETADGKYKLSLYKTVDTEEKAGTLGDVRPQGKLVFAEDYNQDGVLEEVKYSDHWSWIYTLRNNPEAANGDHIWQWAVK